jgi:hypothetical protein
MLAQLVDLFDPMGLMIIAMFIGVPVALVVALVFAVVADFRHQRSGKPYDGRSFPVAPKIDSISDGKLNG